MTAAALGWIAFALAVAGAAFLFLRARASDAARAASAALLAERDQALEATQKRLEQRAAELRTRGEEISELRKKYDKLKKRAGDEREEEKGAPARVRKLEADLEAERADSRGARDEIVRLHAEVERVTAELARVRAELARASGKVAELAPLAERPGLDALERRAEEGDAKLVKLAAALESAQRDAAKYKGRWETLDKAYLVLRGELELKKDEARTQRAEVERLRALEVVLVEPVPPATEPS
jgi:chromosome segregation ATPase